jgi:hypothetical protein
VRLQAVLQLFETNFPGVIWSKKQESFKSGIFQLILITMDSGVTGIDTGNI